MSTLVLGGESISKLWRVLWVSTLVQGGESFSQPREGGLWGSTLVQDGESFSHSSMEGSV